MTRILLALAVTLPLALAARAQDIPASAEFGRASGGQVDAITKGARQTSGSLSLSRSTGAVRGEGYAATLGGELVNDRLWFFAAASALPQMQFATPDRTAFDAKATAQPVDWSNITASFSRWQPAFGTGQPQTNVPTSFLTLRSTSVLSDRMTFDFSFSQRR